MKSLLFSLFSILIIVTATSAQQLRLSADGGVSKLIGSENNAQDFNWGFAVGGHLLFYVDDNILLGIRGAYNRWTPEESDFTDEVNNLFEGDVSGNAWAVEIIPTIRLTTNYPMSMVNFFAQAGAGAYIFSNEIRVRGRSTVDDAAVEEIFGDGTKGRFGIQAGGGFSFGSSQYISLDIFSLYNLIFIEDSNLQYFTINLGLSLGI